MPILKRQTSGSVVCPSCGRLVGVNDETCFSCGRRNPGLWGFAPLVRSLGGDLGFVTLIVGGSVALYVLSLALSGPALFRGGPLTVLAPTTQSLRMLGASGAVPIFVDGQWWTPLSAGWLHAGLLHIVFNMLWVRQLGPATADLYGPGRLVIIYTCGAVTGFLLSAFAGYYLPHVPGLRGAFFSVGASAPIFGLLGALVHYGRKSGSSVVHGQALNYAIMLFVFGLIMPGVDNYAHAGGFVGGYAAARLLNPLEPERLDHVVLGLACLLATAAAVTASLVRGIGVLLR